MNSINYRPEGTSALDEKPSLLQLERAKATNRILEARAVMCDNDHNLIVDLGDIKGVIPREEAAIGIRDGSVKDIAVLSRVNKQICFKVDDILTKQLPVSAAFRHSRTLLTICSRHIKRAT